MKKWKILRSITILFLVDFFLYLFVDLIICINMSYPHPMLGIDALNWLDQFLFDLIFISFDFGFFLILDIILLIISIFKINSIKN